MELLYYKKNVIFPLIVRENKRDSIGTLLTDEHPFISVEKDKLRDFVAANTVAINEGKIVQVDEPPLIIETPNMITDEQAVSLVKNFFSLRKKLPEITSETTLLKLLSTAKAEHRKPATIELIQNRIEEVTPLGMGGISNDAPKELT